MNADRTTSDNEHGALGSQGDELADEEVDMLVADIEDTRVEMTGTLGEIGDRLEPGHLVEQAKDNVRQATIGRVEEVIDTAGDTARETGSMVIETIRSNPVPAALTGLGLFMLWKNRRTGQHASPDSQKYARLSTSDAYASSSYGTGDGGGEGGRNPAAVVGERAGQVGERAGQVMESVGQTAGDIVGSGQQAVGRVGGQVGQQFDHILRTNPLALGAVAIGAGIAAGTLLPETPPEQQILGGAGHKLGELARDAASTAMDRVEDAADQAQDAADQASNTVDSPARGGRPKAQRSSTSRTPTGV